MKEPQIPSPSQLWSRHEELILEVLSEALKSLQQEKDLPIEEDDISFRLYFRIRKANLALRNKGRGLPSIPLWQGQNQPLEEDNRGSPRINKKPDFQWQIVNDLDQNPDEAYRHYIIECKRLGRAFSKKWVFNENYIREGVLRYIKEDYGYGKGTPSGAMIGYIQSMELIDIFNEVNLCANQEYIPKLVLSEKGWSDNSISRLDQSLNRPQSFPIFFSLRHLWVDLRQNYLNSQ